MYISTFSLNSVTDEGEGGSQRVALAALSPGNIRGTHYTGY